MHRIANAGKHVASTTIHEPTWNNTTVISDDLVGELKRLKQQPGKDIVQYGPLGRKRRMMKMVMRWSTIAALVAVPAAFLQPLAAIAPPFPAAVEAHLAAIKRRSMEALLPTLTRGNDLTMIAPNGVKFDTKQQYIDFHRRWFATNDDGKLVTEIVRVIESPALSHALIKYRYSSRDAAGNSQIVDSWLTLTFALEDSEWRLVFDQNTLNEQGAR